MKNDQKIYLLGGSGHALSVLDALQSINQTPKGYFDQMVNERLKIDFLGDENEENCRNNIPVDAILFPAVGSNSLRMKMISQIEKLGYNQIIIAHKNSLISDLAKIDTSTFIAAGTILNALVVVGKGVILNSGSIIEHECEIADFTHIGPGTVLAGSVKVGSSSFIGANSTVKQGVRIGNNVVVGAGSVVLNDINDNTVHAGNPAKFLKFNG